MLDTWTGDRLTWYYKWGHCELGIGNKQGLHSTETPSILPPPGTVSKSQGEVEKLSQLEATVVFLRRGLRGVRGGGCCSSTAGL